MLSGSLEPFALTDVLHLVAGSKVTGKLLVKRAERSGVILLEAGEVVGLATEDGSQLDEMSSIDLALALVDGTSGEFSVEPGPAVPGPMHVDVDELISLASKRRDEWRMVRDSLGSLDATLALASEVPDDVTLTPEEWSLLATAAPGRTALEVARERGGYPFEVAGALAELARKGLLTATAPRRSTPAPASSRGAPAPNPALAQAAERQAASSRAKASKEPEAQAEDGDPAKLLRELMQDETAPPRRAALRIPTREEQRMRLRR